MFELDQPLFQPPLVQQQSETPEKQPPVFDESIGSRQTLKTNDLAIKNFGQPASIPIHDHDHDHENT